MTIKQKIIGKSLGTALLVAAVGLLSAVSMLQIGNTLSATVEAELRETSDVDKLQEAAAQIDRNVDLYLTAVHEHRQNDVASLKGKIDSAFDQINQATSRIAQSLRLHPAMTSAANSPKEGVWDHGHALLLIEHNVRLSRDDWSALQAQIEDNPAMPSDSALADRLTLATGGLLKDSQNFELGAKQDMMRGLRAAQDRVTTSVHFLIVAAVIAVIFAITLASLVALPLAARLARLRNSAVEVGKGNLEARIKVDSNDEIGQLGTAFNDMAAGLSRSRDEIRENESKFRELADTIHEVFWVSDPESTKVQYVNPAFEKIWGRSRDSVYKDLLTFSEAIVPEDRPRVLAGLKKAATDGLDQEYRIVRPDGTMRWIHDRGFPVRDETGQVKRLVGIAADVTDQRLAEEALRQAHAELEQRVASRTAQLQQVNESLRQSEADLEKAKDTAEAANRAKSIVFDTALDAIVTIDSAGLITAWNLQAESMFRWDRTEVLGMRLDQTIISEQQWDAHRRAIDAFLKTGEGPLLDKVAELVARRRNGHEFPVELAITPAGSGAHCTFTAFIRDITSRKQAEADLRQARDAAENANRAKSEFLANMSHEIRTPLNGVIGMSGLLLDTALDEKQRRFAELIKSSGASLAELINDILDFSKIEARKLDIESVDFDLYAIIEDASEIMLIKAAEKGLDLACLTMSDVPRHVKGDPQRVRQILINLVNNAIKFTESGSISIRLTMEEQSREHVTVRFSITDTGIGIPPDRMDRLFKSFSQVDASTTRMHGGTGLGLAISKQLAELMGGSIGVESDVGCGSIFWFTVKLAVGSHAAEPVPAVTPDSRGLRVLAVHSDSAMREILHYQLCSWKLEAAVASTGAEAKKMLSDAAAKGQPYDVAIFDDQLADGNALDLGSAIKARREIAKTVLVILLPIGSDLEPLKLRAAGFSGHLIKPVRQSRLYDAIIDAMSTKSQPRKIVVTTVPANNSASSQRVPSAPHAKILIAEDNRVNQIVASEVLTKHGYACDIADNGSKTVAAFLAGNYDLILMDCSMPELDGFEATRQIRAAEQANAASSARRIPIIALTANAISGDREQCIEAGMDDYVSKPIDPNHMIKAIQTLLAKSRPASQTPLATAATTKALLEIPAILTPSKDAGDQLPPVAIESLLERCMGDAETVSTILHEFESQAVADLAVLRQHVAAKDCAATARVAHTLKGASGMLSAYALADVAFKLEKMGRAGVLADEALLLSQLNDEVQRCIDYLPSVRAAVAKKIEV